MGLIRRLIGTASRMSRSRGRRPAGAATRRRRPARRGSTAGGLMGAVRGFLRGSGRARV